MSSVHEYLWLIPGLPLLAAALTAFFGPRLLRQHSHVPCIAAAAASCVLSVFVLLAVKDIGASGEHQAAATAEEYIESYYTWFKAGTVDVGFTLRADALSELRN